MNPLLILILIELIRNEKACREKLLVALQKRYGEELERTDK